MLVTMTRKCQIDIKLSNGTVLPKGTFIGVAAHANALDSQYFDKPEEFDGFRFEKLRSLPGNDNKYQVRLSPFLPPSSLSFVPLSCLFPAHTTSCFVRF